MKTVATASEKKEETNVENENYFVKLMDNKKIKGLVEKKQGKGGMAFDYLSWSNAVEHLKRVFPDSTWEVKRFEGLPYLKTETGFFVEVAVTVQGCTLAHIHPVLSNRKGERKVDCLKDPDAFEINTSIMRCLAKAIALHGLGLALYTGEDLPEDEVEVVKKVAVPSITPVQKGIIDKLISSLDCQDDIDGKLRKQGIRSINELSRIKSEGLISYLRKKEAEGSPAKEMLIAKKDEPQYAMA